MSAGEVQWQHKSQSSETDVKTRENETKAISMASYVGTPGHACTNTDLKKEQSRIAH